MCGLFTEFHFFKVSVNLFIYDNINSQTMVQNISLEQVNKK